MAFASITYTSASGTTFALTNSDGNAIEYLRQDDISVTVNGVATTAFTFNAAGTSIVLDTAVTSATVRITRTTSIVDATVSFTAGSTLTAQDLNNSDKQNRFALQEFSDVFDDLQTGTGDLGDLGGFIDSGETWVSDDGHAATTGAIDSRVDSKIDTALTTDVVAGNAITITDNSPAAGQITVAVTDGTIDTAELVDSAVTTAKIADGAVTSAKIVADAIDGTKIADDSIDSEHIVNASIDTIHLSDGLISTVKLANDSVTAAKIAANAVGSSELASTAVAPGAYTAADITVDADGRITAAASGTIGTSEIADSSVTTAKIATNAVTTVKIADGNITAGKIGADAVDGSKIADNSINSEHYVDASIDTTHIADQQITSGKLATNAVTTAKINADAITNDKIGDDAVNAENINGLTATITELNQLAGNSLTTSFDSNATDEFPSSSAINTHVVGLIDSVGGFVAIADDQSFPTANPDPSDNAGTVVSISNAGGLVINSSGQSTTGRTTGGATVTITGFPSNMNSTTVQDGLGLQVQTTTTLNTYTYHKLIAREDDIIQLSDDINDFNNRYRVGSSNPTTDNDEGDLFFNTGSDKMLVWDGSEWDEVQSIGEYFIIPSSDFPTWNGSLNDISITSNAPANAEQIILSINGVIQEPVAGTARPTDGFSLNGSTIQLSAAPATGSEAWGVIIGSTVNIGTPSANTVGPTQLIDTAVTAGSYTLSSITVDAQGRITAASSGSAGAADKIEEGNTSVECIDSGTNGQIILSTDGSESMQINNNQRVRIGNGGGFVGNLSVHAETDGNLHVRDISDVTGSNTGVAIDVLNDASDATRDICIRGREAIFHSSGGEAMRIDSSRRVAIGITNPQDYESDGDDLVVGRTGSSAGITIQSSTTGDGTIYFADGTGTNARKRGVIKYTHDSTNAMQFHTDAAERMRITSGGFVGIGSINPTATLQVTGPDTSARGQLTIAGSSGGAGVNSRITFYRGTDFIGHISGNSDHLDISTESGHHIEFSPAGTEQMRITTAGNVGIGTTAPGSLLELNAAAATVMGISLGTVSDTITASRYIGICNNTDQTNLAADSGFSGIEFGGPSSTNEGYLALHTHDNGVASGERMRIQKDGRTVFASSDCSIGFTSALNAYEFRLNTGNHSNVGSMMLRSEDALNADGDQVRFVVSDDNRSAVIGVAKTASDKAGFINLVRDDGNNAVMWFANNNIARVSSNSANVGNETGGVAIGDQTSDSRLKNSITDYTGGLSLVNQLRPVNFKYTNGSDKVHAGFIAQEVQPVIPESVYDTGDHLPTEEENVFQTDEPSILAMSYVEMIPALVNSIKELSTQVDTLKIEIATLKGAN